MLAIVQSRADLFASMTLIRRWGPPPLPSDGTPPTVILTTADESLALKVRTALYPPERLVHLRGEHLTMLPAHGGDDAIVAIDCRGLSRTACESQLLAKSRGPNARLRCVAIVDLADAQAVEVVASVGGQDIGVLIADQENVGALLRALLNDATGSVCAAIALNALSPYLEKAAMRSAVEVLGSGCRVASVKAIERVRNRDRTSLGHDLAREGSPYPKQLIKLARATYAVVLLRRSTMTVGRVSEVVGFSASRWLQASLEELFAARAYDLRTTHADLPAERFVGQLLANWKGNLAGSGGVTP